MLEDKNTHIQNHDFKNPSPLEASHIFLPPKLSHLPNEEVLTRLERLVKSERKIMHLVLWHILEVDSRKLFLIRGFNSLYSYLTQHLGYSENSAYDRMQAARILKIVPDVSDKLETGSLNLTQLVRVGQSLKQDKKLGHPVTLEKTKELLSKLENRNGYETQKIIAVEMNQAPLTAQKLKPQKDDSVRVELTLSSEQFELLKKAQSLLSHVVSDNNLADVITKLAKNYIHKAEGKKPQTGSENRIGKGDSVETPPMMQSFGLEPENKTRRRKYIPLKVKRALLQRAGYACEYIHPESQKRCDSRYQLQTDHKIPLAKGGSNELQNLRVLCGVHNRAESLRWGLRWGLRRP